MSAAQYASIIATINEYKVPKVGKWRMATNDKYLDVWALDQAN